MNITYKKCGNYLLPNLIPDPEPEGELRKFGLMRKSYLENHRRGIYSGLLLSGELKEQNQMLWVWRMDNIRARAEEIVLNEIIYTLWE
ncbi:MAG: TnpV protein [Roseburia sp.]|nr:TnpV protein [Roseburia sp.]